MLPPLAADTTFDKPLYIPSAARGRNQMIEIGGGRALSAISFQPSALRSKMRVNSKNCIDNILSI
jgi:hypothetical protein